MTLDDLFAKKAKKKTKKKNNPQDLLEKLTKEVNKQYDQEGDVAGESAKSVVTVGKDDEWETIDDEEKDIDIQSLQLGNIAISATGEPKQPSKDTLEKDSGAEADEGKKVWGSKVIEPAAVEEPVVEEQPPAKPHVYVPAPLRQGGLRTRREPKPNVESTADFPTLDAAVEPTPSNVKSKAEQEEEESWEQAGVPRKPRMSEMPAIAVNPSPSSYVPPGLRTGGSSAFASHQDVSFTGRREEPPHRNEVGSGYRRSEGVSGGDSGFSSSFGGGWSRGETIIRDQNTTGGTSMASPFPEPTRTNQSSSGLSTGGSTGAWERGGVMKTFRESARDKTEFELAQSNRFAGLGET